MKNLSRQKLYLHSNDIIVIDHRLSSYTVNFFSTNYQNNFELFKKQYIPETSNLNELLINKKQRDQLVLGNKTLGKQKWLHKNEQRIHHFCYCCSTILHRLTDHDIR